MVYMRYPNANEFDYLNSLEVDTVNGRVYRNNIEIGFKQGGYIAIGFQRGSQPKRYFRRSNIIWWAHTGKWPTAIIDHRNRIKTDDRIDNLREATTQQNALNCEMPPGGRGLPKGVCYDPGTNKKRPYKANLVDRGKKFLGRFATVEEATKAYQKADTERRLRVG